MGGGRGVPSSWYVSITPESRRGSHTSRNVSATSTLPLLARAESHVSAPSVRQLSPALAGRRQGRFTAAAVVKKKPQRMLVRRG
jgi:hypothetical protein